MHPKRALPRDSSSGLIVALTWLLASLATAAAAHVFIGVFGALGAGADAYEDHAHGALPPVGLGALALAGTLLLRSAALRIGSSQAIDPAILLARRFATMPPLAPAAAVTAGGFATLLGMEFSEQLIASGHIEGIADALGGNTLIGLAIIAVVAAALTTLGLRSASAILRVTVGSAGALFAWIVVKTPTLIDDAAILRRIQRLYRRGATSALIARCRGLRAPPITVV